MHGLKSLAFGCAAAISLIFAVCLNPAIALAQSAELRAVHGRVMQLYAGGRFAEAIVVAEQAVDLGTSEFGVDHPSTAALVANLADLHTELGHWPDAEMLYRRVATIRTKTLGEHHPELADAYAQLGRALSAQAQYQAAENAYWQALATIDLELARNPHVLNRLNLEGGLYRARAWYNRAHRFAGEERLDEAEKLYESAIAAFEANDSVERAEVAEALNKRATILRALGQVDEAALVEAHAVQVAGGRAGCRLPTVMDC